MSEKRRSELMDIKRERGRQVKEGEDSEVDINSLGQVQITG
jgi:hypothetical protein